MRPIVAISFVAALGFHALLLFGLRVKQDAEAIEQSDEPSTVDVTLVAAADTAEAATEPPPPSSTPQPTVSLQAPPVPVPTPEPVPTPPPPTPEPSPEFREPPPTPPPTPPPVATPAPTTTPVPASTPPPHPKPSASPKPALPKNSPVYRPAKSHPQGAVGHPGPSKVTATGLTGATSGGGSVRYRSNPRPIYPEESMRNRQQGVVIVNVDIGSNGSPTDVSLAHTSGFPLLDEAALQAVRHWSFYPATVAGMAVATRKQVPVRFSLTR